MVALTEGIDSEYRARLSRWYREALGEAGSIIGTDGADGGAVVVHKGTSTIVRGYHITLERNPQLRQAKVCVELLDEVHEEASGDEVPTGDPRRDMAAVTEAARLFAQRARRFLGLRWKVEDWPGIS